MHLMQASKISIIKSNPSTVLFAFVIQENGFFKSYIKTVKHSDCF